MKIINRKATFDFEIREKLEAGIHLLGSEVKAVRLGHADLSGSYVKIIGLEAFLVNAKIFPFQYARPDNYDQIRTRKLLLHKREILNLKHKMEGSGLTIVPIAMYNTKNLIKLEVALGKGKKEYQKKEAKKRKDIDREVAEEFKRHLR
jgi:SsrA-binding protein